jgi:hypothetical protein
VTTHRQAAVEQREEPEAARPSSFVPRYLIDIRMQLDRIEAAQRRIEAKLERIETDQRVAELEAERER